jgi:hypothetical protein
MIVLIRFKKTMIQDYSHLPEKVCKALELKDEDFKRLQGVTKETFQIMLKILEKQYQNEHQAGGKPAKKCPPSIRLLIALQYWREYRDMEHIGYEFGIVKSAVCSAIQWVEKTWIADKTFHLPGKKILFDKTAKMKIVIADATESPIERPKKKQKKYYSGKKKRHTIKTLVVIEEATRQILCIAQAPGSVHDFLMYKDNIRNAIVDDILAQFDSGFQGVRDFHKNSEIPYKNSKNRKLLPLEKVYNKLLSSSRVAVEHTNRSLKIFKIVRETYRNRRRRHGLRMNLFAAIHNIELKQQRG